MVKVNHARAIICYVCHIDRVYAAAPLLSPPNPPSLKSEVSRLGESYKEAALSTTSSSFVIPFLALLGQE